MNTPADSNTRENANTNTDISITANATGFSTKTLNPQILVTLWNVERLGSFSAVARETGWSQPAISQQIRKIERELDAKLVQRTSHGVELTPIGRILARHGQLIDNRVTQAVKDVEEYQRNGSTHIRLVAPPSVCSSFVARVLVHISKTSDIRVSLMQMEPPEAMEALEQGLADCAIIFQYNSLPALAGPDDLEVAPFGVDPLASTKARTCRSNWFRHAANSGSPAAKPARRIWCRWRVPPASHRKSHIRPTIFGPRRIWWKLAWASRSYLA